MQRAFRFPASSPTGRLAPTPVGAEEHRVHIVGFLVPVKITDEEEVQTRNVIIGTR